MSTTSTRWPRRARAEPRLAVVAVLPTPPFWLATAMIPAIFRPIIGAHAWLPDTWARRYGRRGSVVYSLCVRTLLTAAVLTAALLAPASAQAAASATIFYPQTKHSVSFGFKQFFDSRGSLEVFGYPTTEEVREDGWTVQYFQRARFEYHPEHAGTPYAVQLGLLGDLTAGQTFTTARRA